MLPKVMKAYSEVGFSVDLGSPGRLFSVVIDDAGHRTLNCSGGLTVSDVFFFSAVARLFKPLGVFVIGNSFGLSTFVLSELFPEACVDAIDAEIEGVDGGMGSAITRKISAASFPRVNLTIGYSPVDLKQAMRLPSYEFFFIDGMHTNHQVIEDFDGITPFLAERCVVVLHDVASAGMFEGFAAIQSKGTALGFRSFTLGFTQMGCCVLVRGIPELEEYLQLVANDFQGPYLAGFSDEHAVPRLARPFFWDLSFGHIERLVRRKLRRIRNRS